MKKRKDIQIFQYFHKIPDYPLLDNSLFTPFQVGAEYTGTKLSKYRDNTKDNIGKWNPLFIENTGLYWIYKNILSKKNCTYKYIGQCQYRRYFDIDENTDFDLVFDKYFAITSITPIPEPVVINYNKCHIPEPLTKMHQIVSDLYPNYVDALNNTLKNNLICYSCGFITTREIFMKYCDFLFTIFNEYMKRENITSVDDVRKYVENYININNAHFIRNEVGYQMGIFGFLAERLLTAFIIHETSVQNKIILNLQYITPDTNQSKYIAEDL